MKLERESIICVLVFICVHFVIVHVINILIFYGIFPLLNHMAHAPHEYEDEPLLYFLQVGAQRHRPYVLLFAIKHLKLLPDKYHIYISRSDFTVCEKYMATYYLSRIITR